MREAETIRALADERKRKHAQELAHNEKTYNDFKQSHEEQMDTLRETLRRERLNVGTTVEEQIRKVEQDNEALWTVKLEHKKSEIEKLWAAKLAQAEIQHHKDLEAYKKGSASEQQADLQGSLKAAHGDYAEQLATVFYLVCPN